MDPMTCRAAARILVHFRRFPNSNWRHYASKARPHPETLGTYRALRHFDEFYAAMFGDVWPSVRLALLCPNKPCALSNTFSLDTEDMQKRLRSLGALSLRNLCERRVATAAKPQDSEPATSLELAEPPIEDAATADSAASTEQSFDERSRYMPANDTSPSLMSFVPSSRLVYQEDQISEDSYHGFYKPDADVRLPVKCWPLGREPIFRGKLDVAMFPTGDISTFPPPRRSGKERLLDYYLMDGASVLPVLALDLQQGDELADLCAAPGGKLLAALCTGLLGRAVACDASSSRVKRLRECLRSYVPEKQLHKVSVLHHNLLSPGSLGWQFDKILLDVPCTNDRLSVAEDDNNWFSQKRQQERLELPQRQMDMLCQALPLLRFGGSLVYSTCSLSPIQNDGVVHMALQQLQRTSSAQYAVVDLSEAFAPLPFRFFEGCRYGQLALPYLPNNVGPLYVARIERIR
ncbi:5-cytosine rRNA methyltransferase NSUN4 isoform X2 [Dermacentor andersoni]|uniref:5-cytosine rRNA methyltransferase NSUN4 isoform X2 n=1 Tax=Dermacentor andersoni TaxID=34620 RepID=UPI0021557F99|nr:5-methylcytosine rRNA methyltransferase NSUN4-like isoform X2 [Dermacentor andersoni]